MADENLEFLKRVEQALETQTALLGEVHGTTIEQGSDIKHIKEMTVELKDDFKSHKKDIYGKVEVIKDDMVSKKSIIYWVTLLTKIIVIGGLVFGAGKVAIAWVNG